MAGRTFQGIFQTLIFVDRKSTWLVFMIAAANNRMINVYEQSPDAITKLRNEGQTIPIRQHDPRVVSLFGIWNFGFSQTQVF